MVKLRSASWVTAVALAGSGLLLAGCGGQGAGAAPEGWKTLDTEQVSVSYPKEWKALPKSELSEGTDGVAVLVKDGREIAKVGVQGNFLSKGDAKLAAGAAQASIEFNGRIGKQQKIDVPGTDDAQRTDFTQTGDGAPGKAPKGAKINGIDVVGVNAEDHAFLVRIIATEDGADKDELTQIAESVEVKPAK